MYPTIQTLQGFVLERCCMTGIYGIHNKVNDKWYVGQSQNIKRKNTKGYTFEYIKEIEQ